MLAAFLVVSSIGGWIGAILYATELLPGSTGRLFQQVIITACWTSLAVRSVRWRSKVGDPDYGRAPDTSPA